MKKKMLALLALIACSLSAQDSFLINEPFNTEDSLKRFKPTNVEPVLQKENDSAFLKFNLTQKRPSAGFRIPLKSEDFCGRHLLLSWEWQVSKVARPKSQWDGAKVMLSGKSGGKYFYQGLNKIEPIPWQKAEIRKTIPADTTNLFLSMGFQDSYGTVSFRNLKVIDLGMELDFSKEANFGFVDKKAGDGKGGWSDQGPGNDGSKFERSKNQLYAKIPFKVIDPAKNGGRAILAMRSPHLQSGLASATVKLPQPSKGPWLYLLHTMCHGAAGTAGTIKVNFADGKTQTIPVVSGKDISDWWGPKRLQNACPAVIWNISTGGTVGVYVSRFKIDVKQSPIVSVTFQTADSKPVWLILGATVAGKEYTLPDTQPFRTKADAKWKPLPVVKPGIIAGSALDRSAINPVTKVMQRVIVNNKGQLALEKSPDKPIRFLTVADTYQTYEVFKSKAAIEEYTRILKLRGYNMARQHYLDSILMSRSKKALKFNKENLDHFDYYVYCMKKNGIYLNLDAMCSRYGYDLGNTWIPDKSGRDFRYDIYFKESVRENWRQGVKQLLCRTNPYTKTRLIDDPVLAIVNGINEQEFAMMSWRYPEKPEYMLPSWRAFLKEQYKNIEQYNMVWQKNAKTWDDIPIFTHAESLAKNKQGSDVAAYKTMMERNMYQWFCKELRGMGYKGIIINFDMCKTLRYISLRKDFPIVAMHSYHAHPSGRSINQSSSFAVINRMYRDVCMTRLTNKPMLVTEYGCVFWNKYRYEEAFCAGAYAALQDHSALTVHAQTSAATPPSVVLRPFDCRFDPIIEASEFLTAFLFNRGDVAVADKLIRLDLKEKDIYQKFKAMDGMHQGHSRLGLIFGTSTAIDPDFPVRKNEVALSSTGGAEVVTRKGYTMTVDKPGEAFDLNGLLTQFKQHGFLPKNNRSNGQKEIYESCTGELFMDTEKHLMSVNTPKLQGVCMEAGNKPVVLNDLTISDLTTRGNATLVSIDGQPLKQSKRMVFVYITNALNSNMLFSSKEMSELKGGMGKLPILVECGSVQFKLKSEAAESLKLYALNQDGSRRFELPLEKKNGVVTAKIDTAKLAGGPSIYFELSAK